MKLSDIVPDTSTELAVSNKLVDYIPWIDETFKISPLRPVIKRIIILAFVFPCAFADGCYNAIWFSAKLLLVGSREVVRRLTGSSEAPFAKKLTMKEVQENGRRAAYFFAAWVSAAPRIMIFSEEGLIEIYREQKLINSLWRWRWNKVKGTVKNAKDDVLGRIRSSWKWANRNPFFAGMLVAGIPTLVPITLAHAALRFGWAKTSAATAVALAIYRYRVIQRIRHRLFG